MNGRCTLLPFSKDLNGQAFRTLEYILLPRRLKIFTKKMKGLSSLIYTQFSRRRSPAGGILPAPFFHSFRERSRVREAKIKSECLKAFAAAAGQGIRESKTAGL